MGVAQHKQKMRCPAWRCLSPCEYSYGRTENVLAYFHDEEKMK
ncbi:hypothetical protein P262_01983 [Cronobacter malonaticus]|uniref:Uncharacterized protein n=1 Tax=Cronobacter malonaticus TaxID=413503 RepID=V5TXA1_9ENTR|nr:hypothetical protein P262_01983 [Cronobacter malonaticus]CCJ93325.1 hypothetical protein BN131_998 [Cronobacter malonaticus 681]